jgi:transcription antitermination factor NusG
MSSEQWYVVQVEPARDYRARDRLRLLRFEVFLPEAAEWKTWRSGTQRDGARYCSTGPLFPGYVFVRFAASDAAAWQRLVKAPYVVRLMCRAGGGEAAAIGDPMALAEDVRQRFGLGDRGAPMPAVRFRAGDRVRITGGLLEGFEGTCRGSVRERIKILIDAAMGGRVIELPDTLVSAAASA